MLQRNELKFALSNNDLLNSNKCLSSEYENEIDITLKNIIKNNFFTIQD